MLTLAHQELRPAVIGGSEIRVQFDGRVEVGEARLPLTESEERSAPHGERDGPGGWRQPMRVQRKAARLDDFPRVSLARFALLEGSGRRIVFAAGRSRYEQGEH